MALRVARVRSAAALADGVCVGDAQQVVAQARPGVRKDLECELAIGVESAHILSTIVSNDPPRNRRLTVIEARIESDQAPMAGQRGPA